MKVVAPLLESCGAGVLCLVQPPSQSAFADETLTAVARSDDPRWPARDLPEHTGERLLRLAGEDSYRDMRLDTALLGALELPREWICGLVLPLPVRDGVMGLLLIARPTATPREARGALVALATQLALALEGARLTESVHVQRSEARFASLVQNSSDLITVVGSDATITYQSPSSEHVLGYPAERASGHPLRSSRGARRRRAPAATAGGRRRPTRGATAR